MLKVSILALIGFGFSTIKLTRIKKKIEYNYYRKHGSFPIILFLAWTVVAQIDLYVCACYIRLLAYVYGRIAYRRENFDKMRSIT